MSSSSTTSSTASSTTSSDPEESIDESNTSEGEQMFLELIALQQQMIERGIANIRRRRQRKKRRHIDRNSEAGNTQFVNDYSSRHFPGLTMKAVVITAPGGPEVLKIQQVEDPQFKDDEVLIKVEATALNRADTLQRQGEHPPPKGASQYPGLECSGTIEAIGKNVSRWKIGDQVCALLSGGGYAEKVAVPAAQVLPVPSGVSLKDAASFPKVACTVWSTVFMMSRLAEGETFLIHGGSSGIGTFAIQIAKYHGVKVFVTAGSEEKLAVCKELGADVCIDYKTEDFVARVKEETGGRGVDVILDNIGGPYFQKNLDSLNIDGRLFIIGFMGGMIAEVNLVALLAKRLTVQAAGLRNRSLENKAQIVSEVEKNVWPAIMAGKVKPVVYKYLPLSEAAEGHRLMESSQHIGKILLLA